MYHCTSSSRSDGQTLDSWPFVRHLKHLLPLRHRSLLFATGNPRKYSHSSSGCSRELLQPSKQSLFLLREKFLLHLADSMRGCIRASIACCCISQVTLLATLPASCSTSSGDTSSPERSDDLPLSGWLYILRGQILRK